MVKKYVGVVLVVAVLAVFNVYTYSLYAGLSRAYAELEDEYERLRVRYGELRNAYEILTDNYTRLCGEYADLEKRHEALQRMYEDLEKSYGDLKEAYEDLRDALNLRVVSYADEELFRRFVGQIDPSEVAHVVEELRITRHTPPREVVRRVLEWVLWNTAYMGDARLPYVRDGRVEWMDNHMSLPRETLERGGGDCEDLAILTYAILRNVYRGVWLIMWMSEEGGHMAVLVNVGAYWCIVDPAMCYATGAEAVYLRLVVREDASFFAKTWILKVFPTELHPKLKEFIRSVVDLPFVYKGRVDFRSDLGEVVREWLRVSGGRGAHVYSIANDREVEFFDSTEEFLEYMGG